MAFGSPFIGALLGGYANAALEKQRRAYNQPSPLDQIQIIDRKISCEYCGRKGSTDQCVSCGAPMGLSEKAEAFDGRRALGSLVDAQIMPCQDTMDQFLQLQNGTRIPLRVEPLMGEPWTST